MAGHGERTVDGRVSGGRVPRRDAHYHHRCLGESTSTSLSQDDSLEPVVCPWLRVSKAVAIVESTA